jgi:2-hydroxy-6-oxonona-2,4-dienedioate hydrolase
MSLNYEVQQIGKFKFIEVGEGEPLILLHGLFGAMSNFIGIIEHFKHTHRVVVPILPLFELDILHTTVGGLEKHFSKFIEQRGYQNINLLGNSLGGHIALVHVLKSHDKIKSLILTGSSGLFENGMGDTYPRRGDYEYIRKKTEMTFYDPNTATKELVDEVYQIVNERMKTLKVISLARSAIKNNLGDDLKKITLPTLLIWGNNDSITPPFVGREFNKLIPNSEIHFIDHCGHAPMMEVPQEFNIILEQFFQKLKTTAAN